MNKANRAELERASTLLDSAYTILESLASEEQDKHDNLSEGLQESEKGQQFADNADNLNEAASAVDDAKSNIEQALSSLENVA